MSHHHHDIVETLAAELHKQFGIPPREALVVRSPYRICPLGAHIDHQLGCVTAMAINRAVHLAYVPAETREVRLRSISFDGEVRFSLDDVPAKVPGDWGNFARGAVLALQQRHALRRGIVGVTAGALAEGGLSSSAAVGVAYLLALEQANGLEVPERENIELDRYIENEYLGLRNGILDQSAILLSREEQLTVIDCKSVSHELAEPGRAMPPFAVLIAFSGLRQALVTTGYNKRVEECAEAARVLLETAGRRGVRPLLGHVTPEEWEQHRSHLDGAPARRARHFFSEMERVRRGVAAWRDGDLATFGRLVSESGRSSIDNYECGSPPLIDLYEIMIQTEGVLGARFSGAGFRGCCVALLDPAHTGTAVETVRERYAAAHPEHAAHAPVLVCHSADGARILAES